MPIDHDHSAYIKQYRQHGLTVYSNADVASDFDGVKELEPMKKYHLGEFTVIALSAYHNVDCLSFIIDHESFGRIVFITDSYQWPYKVSNVTYWMIEANYDKDIVIEAKCDGIDIRSQSQYHMAIDETLNTLKRNRSSSTMGIFLIHLSDALSDAKGFERRVHNEIGVEAHSVDMGDVFGLKTCDF